MCDDNDLEGVRLWFYGGTPPLDEAAADEHAAPESAWPWPAAHQDHPACVPTPDPTRELAAA